MSPINEYTPVEEEVREAWAQEQQEVDWDGSVIVSNNQARAQFDRFIARVKAEAWDEGYEAAAKYHALDTEHGEPNPYREDEDDE